MLSMNATPPVKKYFAVKQSDGTPVFWLLKMELVV